ncbi:MAG: glycosyltransferase [Alphaproteobacteria bacterium]|nr:glycosyltransferase [Alphaproteobacteria bacterium]
MTAPGALLSVVIPAFNEAALLPVTLGRIRQALEEACDAPWEILVCDNGSTDETASRAAEAGARVVHEPIRQIARARNAGAAAAEGAWLLFIDADAWPTPALMAEVMALIRGGAHVGCGVTVRVEGGPLWNKLYTERLNPSMRLLKWSGGVFLLCRRDAFRAIGGFAEGLYAMEEIDFIARLRWHAWRRGLSFAVLHRNPVVVQGRKGPFSLRLLARLFASTVVALALFALHVLSLGRLRIRGGRRLLSYWYGARR